MDGEREPEYVHTIVIGAGQAGLSAGYHLARRGIPFLILDANEKVGDSWRQRWDSLRLFTPARFDSLDGMAFPAPPHSFPTKDEMGDYLESYARRFDLPVRSGVRVDRLTRAGERFVVESGASRWQADNVIVAMANYQQPHIPEFARLLDPAIRQLHSSEYRNLSQLREGGVLVVGAGNSGSEIGMEVARAHKTWMSGNSTGEIPFNTQGAGLNRPLVRIVLRGLFHRVLTVKTPIGRKMRPKVLSHGMPLIRVKSRAMTAAGIQRVPRTTGVQDGRPLLADGRVLDVQNVIWCTGYHPGFSWIDLPVVDGGQPRHQSGIVADEPGLYFIGLLFLHALSSEMIHGVSRDAERAAGDIARRAGLSIASTAGSALAAH